MAIHKLSRKFVEHAPTGKHEDGSGLRLVVSKNQSKKWVLRFTLAGKRREMGLGGFPAVSLGEARSKAREAKHLISQGKDPFSTKATPTRTPTFSECAKLFIESQRSSWSNPKHTQQWESTLNTYAFPVIGHKPVNEISTEDLIQILQPMWIDKTETGRRVQGRIENILDYAHARGYKDQINAARWKGHLDKLLPKPRQVQPVTHHPAMPYQEVHLLLSELKIKASMSAKALQLLIYTATRSGEVLGARWEEIDLDEKKWTIPASRTKTKKEHYVPLPSQAVDLLRSIPKEPDNPHVFLGMHPGKSLSNMALLTLMRKMGYGKDGERGHYVPHGFRSSFRDWAGEVSNYPWDVCEMALGHTIQNKVEAAYRRGNLYQKRQKMMQDWADYISPPDVLVSYIKLSA